jgi:hypothetical protein
VASPEPEPKSGKHFHERWQFQAAVAVIGLLTAVWAFSGIPKPWDLWGELTAAETLPLRNTEIILDASEPMGTSFGKATKLAVAGEAVGRYAAAGDNIGLALRRVGGSCDEASPQLVGFGAGHSQEVSKKAKEQQPEGKSNLTLAVRTAISDFADEEFHRQGSENQIVIFAGDGDECGELAGQEIRDELESANVQAVFKVFGIKVSSQTLASLESLKRQLQGTAPVEIRNAENVQQLYKSVAEEAPEAAGEEGNETTGEGEEGATGGSGVGGEG